MAGVAETRSARSPLMLQSGNTALSWLAGCLLAIAVLAGPARAAPMSDTVISGGPIITMAGEAPETVEAIGLKGGTIIAVGTLSQVNRQASRRARQIDLRGHTLLPGFIDAHGHVGFVGQSASMAQLKPPPVGPVDSIAALQEALRAHVPPEGSPVIIGSGYDDSALAERRHPTRHDLDAVQADSPLLIVHTSGHFGVMNSAMLQLAGIGPDTPNPPGGIIRREADGKTPDGVLEETAFFGAISRLVPSSPESVAAGLQAGAAIYAAHGITTGQDGRTMPESVGGLLAAGAAGTLPIDVVALIAGERDWPEQITARIGQPYTGRVRIAGLKFVVDGSPQGRTAWLRDPVPVPPHGHSADYHGYPAIDLELFDRKLAQAAQSGWQVFAHVNGDAAAQALIDGVRRSGLSGRRSIAIHNQVVRPEQLAEMKALDIQPSFFANHTYYWGDWHREVALGPQRADFISPQASAIALGLRPSIHNDSPVVPPDMMRLVWSAVNRRTQSGDILGPLERVSPFQALQQITINAAWQIHEDARKGSLRPGKLADLVVLDGNPLTVEPAQIADIKVVATFKEGTLIFGTLPQE